MKRWQIPRTWLILGLAATWTLGVLPETTTAAHAARGWGVRDRDRDGIPDYRDRNRGSRIRYSRDRYRGSTRVRNYRNRNRTGYIDSRPGNRYIYDQYGNRYSRDGIGIYPRTGYGTTRSWNGTSRRWNGTTRSWSGRARGRRDLDRDGIPNARDRDRDGDGIPNNRDRYPNRRSGSTAGRPNYDWDRDGVLNWNDHYPRDRRRR
jgi:hypothetical protein